ncbi:ribulose-phosphate 3-epimerase [Clostridium sp. YIM B02505]|uniref:Ribulose-phosphate 3-epimerase n=1 Tax=Clostridium yunnanense TaxID=2800325 RepID=A0ABS1EWD1_9CLOT|nr:ribulose-phosphate 3-epimerase [Clostridium yunnanense]MBK1813641.1 ribulose-phosphate 3-epimerase [Clostridium yunnanense]
MKLAASIMCGNQLNLDRELKALEEAKVDLLHCDVMDGVFVNNLAMGPYVLEAIKNATNIPLDIHLATINPEKYIKMYSYLKPEYMSFQIETSNNVERDIYLLREQGIKPVLAISPETPIENIEKYLLEVEMILAMTVNPGFAGQKFRYEVIEKIARINKLLKDNPRRPMIEVDGCINKTTMEALGDQEVDVFVLGTSALFKNDGKTYKTKIEEIRESYNNCFKVNQR